MAARLIDSDGHVVDPVGGWMPCSDRSLERRDPLAGTGGRGDRWFLVEIDGAWGRHAFLQSRIDPDVAAKLVRRIEAAGMRPLAIRRTGKRADERRRQSWWRWAIVDSRPGTESIKWDVVRDPADLLDVPLDGSAGVHSSDPIICVCTHARHDQCCAVKGRPAVSSLARAYPAQTWECSHLGGDRFAATMILFPHGLYYGRVPAEEAPAIAAKYWEGEVDPRYFRGRSSLTNAAQAAEAYVREATSDLGVRSFVVDSEEQTDAGWTVVLDRGADRFIVRMAETASEPMLSTCGATTPARVREFALDSIGTIPGGGAQPSSARRRARHSL